MTLEASSPVVTTTAGAFKGVSLSLTGASALQEGAVEFDGALNAALADTPAGRCFWAARFGRVYLRPLNRTSRRGKAWRTRRYPAGGAARAENAAPVASAPLTAGIHDFSVRGIGISVTADLDLSVPPDTDAGPVAPELRGGLSARVDDWSKLAALAGTPLSSEPASLDIRLANTAGRQSASLNASLPCLVLKEPDRPATVRLQNVTTRLDSTDLFGAPSIDLALRTGRGKAAFLIWSVSEASVKGNGGTGDFTVSLRQEGRRASRRSDANAERLDLAGRYDLSRPSVLTGSFAIREPRSKTGLELTRLAELDFSDGIRIKDCAIAFQPGGTMTADAVLTPANMTASFALTDLPFTFFALSRQPPCRTARCRQKPTSAPARADRRGPLPWTACSNLPRIPPALARTRLPWPFRVLPPLLPPVFLRLPPQPARPNPRRQSTSFPTPPPPPPSAFVLHIDDRLGPTSARR